MARRQRCCSYLALVVSGSKTLVPGSKILVGHGGGREGEDDYTELHGGEERRLSL